MVVAAVHECTDSSQTPHFVWRSFDVQINFYQGSTNQFAKTKREEPTREGRKQFRRVSALASLRTGQLIDQCAVRCQSKSWCIDRRRAHRKRGAGGVEELLVVCFCHSQIELGRLEEQPCWSGMTDVVNHIKRRYLFQQLVKDGGGFPRLSNRGMRTDSQVALALSI